MVAAAGLAGLLASGTAPSSVRALRFEASASTGHRLPDQSRGVANQSEAPLRGPSLGTLPTSSPEPTVPRLPGRTGSMSWWQRGRRRWPWAWPGSSCTAGGRGSLGHPVGRINPDSGPDLAIQSTSLIADPPLRDPNHICVILARERC